MEISDTYLSPYKICLRSSAYTTCLESVNKCQLTFELNKPISCEPNISIFCSLSSFSFTNSFYTINENNCNLFISFNGSTIKYILAFGNYDIDSLLIMINQVLAANLIVLTFSSVTNKITVTSTIYSIKFTDDGTNNNIYEMLGFNDIGTTTFTSSFVSPHVVNLISNQLLHITTDLNLNSVGLKSNQKYNILDTVLITSQPGSVQAYKSNDIFKYKLDEKVITSISIGILNQDFNKVHFNNIDWFCEIAFTFCYTKAYIMPNNYLNYDASTSLESELIEEGNRQHLREIEQYHMLKERLKKLKKINI